METRRYLYRKALRVLASTAYADRAELVLGAVFDGSDPGYPFLLDVRAVSIVFFFLRDGFLQGNSSMRLLRTRTAQ